MTRRRPDAAAAQVAPVQKLHTSRAPVLATLVLALVAGCASSPAPAPADPPPVATSTAATCAPPIGPVTRPDWCALPADVRAFVDDRDGCDHFRAEPWPEGDTDYDRERRRQLVDAVRRLCAGTDGRLDALLRQHRDNAAVMQVLSAYERDVEAGP